MDAGDTSSLPASITSVMHFCPIDQNLLHITDRPVETTDASDVADVTTDDADAGPTRFRWYCLTCDYTYPIEDPVRIDVPLVPKEADRIIGGDEAWSGAPETGDVRCEKCGCKTAYYREMQTRSADEPMTLFYKCKGCGDLWRQ